MPKQSTDISGVPFGITYAGPGLTWKIIKGVSVQATTAGVYSTFTDSKLVNKGSVFGTAAGVLFQMASGDDLVVVNKAKGEIGGNTYGVGLVGYTGSALVENDGSITSGPGGYGVYAVGSSDTTIENNGSITGNLVGVFQAVSTLGGQRTKIDNDGTISGQYAMYIGSATGSRVKITNHDDGKMEGSLFSLVSAEKTVLKNDGKMIGDVALSTYDDKIVNKGKIKGDVHLGSGNDVYKAKGKAKAGLIDGGDGNDKIVLGKKADKLLFDSALNAATNVDTIKKFKSGKDAFYLDDDIFTTITPGTLTSAAFHKGTSAVDADDRIIYDKKSGALYYDPDGVGGVAQTQFAKLDPGTKLKASDFTIGEFSIL